jgi:NADH-quinone oxidoreductase subunit M
MGFLDHWLLTILLLLPAAGGVAILFIRSPLVRCRTALGLALGTFCASLLVLILFHRQPGPYEYAPGGIVQMVCQAEIIPALHVNYRVAVDGLSLPFVLLTTLVGVLACGASWNDSDRSRIYYAMIFWLESATLGVFLSFDLLLLWVFLAISLIPCCALILLGVRQRRGRAVIAFLTPMLIGTACLFVAVLGERLMSTRCFTGGTLDLLRLSSRPCADRTLFLLMLIGFAARHPVFPVHSWLAVVAAECPPAVMAMLIGLVPLTGGYGLLRVVMPLFPAVAGSLWWMLAGVGIITVLYGALNSIGQTNLRSALVHVIVAMSGFACIGIAVLTPAGVNASAMILLSQALVGPFILILASDDFRREGLWAAPLAFGWIAELILPGLLGQLMVVLGAFQTHAASPLAIDLLIAAMCVGILLIGTAGTLNLRRLISPGESASAPATTVLASVAIAALLLAILASPFCFVFTHGALESILRAPR